jgi:hypothetical protein
LCQALICFTCHCAFLHPPPGVAHLHHYPLCTYTCVFCLSVVSLSSLPAFVLSFPSLSLSRPPGFWPLLVLTTLPVPEPACHHVPLLQLWIIDPCLPWPVVCLPLLLQ